jgi:hypothetical protein
MQNAVGAAPNLAGEFRAALQFGQDYLTSFADGTPVQTST